MSDKSKHANKTSFQKGKSGNPGGRSPRVGPNGETWTQLLRAMTPQAAERIERLLTSHDDEIALKALAMWAPYAWGKPVDNISLDADIKGAGLPVIQIVRAAEAPARED